MTPVSCVKSTELSDSERNTTTYFREIHLQNMHELFLHERRRRSDHKIYTTNIVQLSITTSIEDIRTSKRVNDIVNDTLHIQNQMNHKYITLWTPSH